MPFARRLSLSTLAAAVVSPSIAKPKPAASVSLPASGDFPHALPVPGGVARIALGEGSERPVARSGEIPLLVVGSPRGWTALVGIPLSAALGQASITVTTPGSEARSIGYTVRPKKYAEQRLTVEPKHVDLSPEDLARFERERDHQREVMAIFSQPLPEALAMQAPVPGPRSSSFGLRRVFLITAGDHDRIDRRIRQHLSQIGGAIARSEPCRIALAASAASGLAAILLIMGRVDYGTALHSPYLDIQLSLISIRD